MSLNLSTAAPLKPEIRLAQAVSQFEACLSDRQKVAFRNQRTQSLKSPPSTKDVMRITAEIDISQKAGGRCFGPRFTKFLHGAQQFAALGDILVGSSQNVIACGVWSVLRITLLASTNRSAYIESLSLLLMEAGHSTQQHSDLALLYPRSKSLQTLITEYFIVVVRICLRFQLFAQKSAFGKFASSLNDADIKEARSSLLAWSKSIQAEIATLVAQRIETEAESNSRFRAMMSSSSKSASQQQKQIAFRNTLNRCSTHDYETTWRQIRKSGNTSLYAQMPEYNQWTISPDFETLILVGKLGYGKSVTLANIVDDLNLRIDPGVTGLAYFFCRHDLPESLVAKTIIGALVRQIISPFPHLFEESEAVDTYDIYGLRNLMRRVVPPKYIMYIILDGLDLCSPLERETTTEQLEYIKADFNIHTCISCRLEPGTGLQSVATAFEQARVVSLPDNTPDIEASIIARLEAALSNHSLSLGDPALILEIQQALLQGSQHMFLWVALQIQALCTMQTDHDIREAIADLPRDLSQIYSRILQQAKRPGRPLQTDIFKLIISARRPLTTDEMKEALSVTPGDTTWNPSKLLNSISSALATCGPLITVDEEEHTIRTVHPSVNQFLLHDSSTFSDMGQEIHFTMKDAQALISSIIVTYLSYGVFGTELATRLPPLNVGSAPSHIIHSMAGTSKNIQTMALKLLRSRKQPAFDASKTLAYELKRHSPSNVHDFHFQHYAKSYILEHFAEFPVTSCAIPGRLFQLFKQGTICVMTDEQMNGLRWLMLQPPGSADVIGICEQIDLAPGLPWQSIYERFRDLFTWAIETGRVDAISALLDLYRPILYDTRAALDDPESLVSPALRTVCQLILSEPLYQTRHVIQDYSLLGSRPLALAISKDQDLVAETLIGDKLINLNEGADFRFRGRPISVAMKRGNVRILKLLLSPDMRKQVRLTEPHARDLLRSAEQLVDRSIVALVKDYIEEERSQHPAIYYQYSERAPS